MEMMTAFPSVRSEGMPTNTPIVPDVVHEIPLRPDGTIDAARIDISDREERNSFVAQLGDVCKIYGPVETIETMLPLMIDACQYDDAAVPIAQALAEIGNSLRVTHSPFQVMFELLKELFRHVDGKIGELAARAAVDFINAPSATIADRASFVATVVEFANGSEGVSGKCTAAFMLPAAYNVARMLAAEQEGAASHSDKRFMATTATGPMSSPGPSKNGPSRPYGASDSSPGITGAKRASQVKTLFHNIIRDSSTAVRRSAAASLGLWLNCNPSPELLTEVQAWTIELIKDKLQDSVRYTALPHLVTLARQQTTSFDVVQKLAVQGAKDPSWRVRWTAARHLVPMMMCNTGKAGGLLPSITTLAEDEEAEVRSCIAMRLGEVASILSSAVVSESVVPLASRLCNDEQLSVRAAAASSLCDVCRTAREEEASLLLDVVVKLIEDESDVVQLNILRSLPSLKERLSDVIYMNRITSPLLRVSQVSVSRWRVRERVAEQLRHLVQHVDLAHAGALEAMMHNLIRDPVAAVRVTAMASLPHIAAKFGSRWSRAHISKFAKDLKAIDGYRERQLYAHVLEAMLPFASSQQSCSTPPPPASPGTSPGATPGNSPGKSIRAGSRQREGSVGSTSGRGGAAAAIALAAQNDAFWMGMAEDLRLLAQDRVSSVRLAISKFVHSPAAGRVPELNAVFDSIGEMLALDANEEVRAATEQELGQEAPY
jgi:HEAT repeat protein